MRTKFYTAAAAAALMVTTVSAQAAMITVDTFDTFQAVTDTPEATQSNVSTITASEAIGGNRTLRAQNTQSGGSNASNDTSLEADSGLLQFSNATGARGEGTVTYDGMSNDDIDLLQGNTFESSFFLFNLPTDPDFQFDGIADFSVTVTDFAGSIATYSEQISPAFNPQLFFTQFNGSADFSRVDSLEFFISTTNTRAEVDGALDSITIDGVAPVPLPASGLLLLGGLGGISVLRRRRKS